VRPSSRSFAVGAAVVLRERLGEPVGGRVDHRVPSSPWLGGRRRVVGGAHEPGLDPELPRRSRSSVRNSIRGAVSRATRSERGVLEQVARQLERSSSS
jgi:hypothetical protein